MQVLLQLAAARGMESVCLVSNKEEAALADRLGAWKAAELKEVICDVEASFPINMYSKESRRQAHARCGCETSERTSP